jgi:hypothetical protein
MSFEIKTKTKHINIYTAMVAVASDPLIALFPSATTRLPAQRFFSVLDRDLWISSSKIS